MPAVSLANPSRGLGYINNWISPALGQIPLAELTAKHLDDLYRATSAVSSGTERTSRPQVGASARRQPARAVSNSNAGHYDEEPF